MLKTFIQEYKNGQRPEDSVISVNTMRSVQEGNEDLWKQVASELEDAGITEEQVNQNKTTITEWIIKALSKGSVEHCSLVSLSFHTAREPRTTNSLTSGQTLNTVSSLAINEFPGPEFLGTLGWAKDVLAHLERVEEPRDGFCLELLQEHILRLIGVLANVQSSGAQDMTSLYYHEKVVRKDQMVPTLAQLSNSLVQAELFLNASADDEDISINQQVSLELNEEENVEISIVDVCDEICKDTSTLEEVFSRMSSFFLCDLEDQLKLLVREVSNGNLPKGTLESWDDLASTLCEEGHLQIEELISHQTSVQSLLKVLIEEDERLELTYVTEFGSEALESSKSKPESSLQSPGMGSSATGRTSVSDAVNNYSLSGESESTSKNGQKPVVAPVFQRAAVLFVDWADEGREPEIY
jgi:Asp-tRNA(Asn)/Glu-tRNA(Gln) amidotransferase C subunit